MTVTKVLGNQTGIQHQGVQDKSEADPRDALLNVVFTGNFKRGRMDRPFKVTPHDYRAKLGHDPENQAYSAIEDALTDGAPFVWVQRVGANASGSHKIDILPDLQYSAPEREQSIWWTLEIDNEFVTDNIGDDGDLLEEYLKSNSSTLGITGEYTDSPSKITLTNLTNNRKFVRLIPSILYKSEMSFSGNGTVSIGSDGTISFWLEANEDATELPEVVYRLTIDDKGLLPSDNIYSGTIEPPLPGIVLGFNIQQYTPNGSNGRVFNIYSDPTGLQVSEDGATWWVDKSTVDSSWDFPVESDFTTPATYELSIHEFMGYPEPEVTPASLEYVVEESETEPTDWDVKYFSNNQWYYELTGDYIADSWAYSKAATIAYATEIVIGDRVETIGSKAFMSMKNMTKLTLGQNVKNIYPEAFYNATALTELIIPDSTLIIYTKAFSNASALQKVIMGRGLTSVKSGAFTHTFNLKAVIFQTDTPPQLDYEWMVTSAGTNGYSTGASFVPDHAYSAYSGAIAENEMGAKRLYPLSELTAVTGLTYP